jgi:TonB family protein
MKKRSLFFNCIVLLLFAFTKVNGQDAEVIKDALEPMPEFPGGQTGLFKYITDNTKYPENARKNGEEGTVYVNFIVNKEGKVTQPKVTKGRSASLDAEALRLVNAMPLWSPGVQAGKPVAVQYTLPIRFSLTMPDRKNKNQ